MSEDNVYAYHKFIHSKEELSELQGSKYVQSDTLDTYKEAEKYLKEGKEVLYTGCPCQIAGLNNYLGKAYDNLLTVDLVCHGVPSRKILEKFVIEKEAQYGTIKNLKFRTKELVDNGGWGRSHTIKFVTGADENIFEERGKSTFLNAFLKTLSIHSTCGTCVFSKIPRQGDMTIGDFWGISKYSKDLNDDLGTSVVLVNNQKAKKIFESLAAQLHIVEKVPLEIAIQGNKNIEASPWVNPRSKRYYDIIDKYSMEKAYDYAANRRFDIGYVGWWYGANYGSVLTNFALHEVLTKQLGKTVLMVSFPGSDSNKDSNKSSRFALKHYDFTVKRNIDQYADLNSHCEKFVLGSDQLWNWYCIRNSGHHFLLDWVKKQKVKIAYSTSFGHSKSFFPAEERMEIAELLQQFDSISVRENEGVDILRDDFGVSAVRTLDPVFLCDKKRYDEVADEVDPLCSDDYIFAYILNPTEEKRRAIYQVADIAKKKVIILIDGQSKEKKENAHILGDENVLLEVEIEQWIRLVKDACFIITDSFHGMCFSIINSKNFIAIKNQKRGNSRFISLLDAVNLKERLVDEKAEDFFDKLNELFEKSVDYEKVWGLLNKEKEDSMNWLKNALDKPKQPERYFQLLSRMIKEQQKQIEELRNKMNL